MCGEVGVGTSRRWPHAMPRTVAPRQSVGILALEVYFPKTYVRQDEMGTFLSHAGCSLPHSFGVRCLCRALRRRTRWRIHGGAWASRDGVLRRTRGHRVDDADRSLSPIGKPWSPRLKNWPAGGRDGDADGLEQVGQDDIDAPFHRRGQPRRRRRGLQELVLRRHRRTLQLGRLGMLLLTLAFVQEHSTAKINSLLRGVYVRVHTNTPAPHRWSHRLGTAVWPSSSRAILP